MQPVAMGIPFAFTASGGVDVRQSATTQLTERVTALASTQPGERVGAAAFGVDTARLLFGPHDSMSMAEIRHSVQRAISLYEPSAVLVSVQPVLDPSGSGVAGVMVNAARKDLSSSGARGAAYTNVRIAADGTVHDYASTAGA